MRRLMALVAIAGLLVLAGCGSLPKGTDGDLVDDWGSLPAVLPVLPSVGMCLDSAGGDLIANPQIPCTSSHLVEIVFVGVFTGAVAEKSTQPEAGSAVMQDSYGLCQAPAKKYLGADWHDGNLALTVMVPDVDGWDGGAHWFACAISVASYVDDSTPTTSTGSVRGALSKPGKLKLACVNWDFKPHSVANMAIGSCAKKHSGEFAGTFTIATKSYPSKSHYFTLGDHGCEAVVAHYLGFSGSTDSNSTVGWVWVYNDSDDWAEGNRTIRCYASAYTGDHKFSGTVKGLRNEVAPG